MKAKYSPWRHPNQAEVSFGSFHIWRRLLRGRDLGERYIHLQVKDGSSNLFFEWWLTTGYINQTPINSHLACIKDLATAEGDWDHARIANLLGVGVDVAIEESGLRLQEGQDSLI